MRPCAAGADNGGMSDPQAKPGLASSPVLAFLIGLCSVGLLAAGAWRVASGNRDWWVLAVDGLLGAGGVWFAIEVFLARGRRPPGPA